MAPRRSLLGGKAADLLPRRAPHRLGPAACGGGGRRGGRPSPKERQAGPDPRRAPRLRQQQAPGGRALVRPRGHTLLQAPPPPAPLVSVLIPGLGLGGVTGDKTCCELGGCLRRTTPSSLPRLLRVVPPPRSWPLSERGVPVCSDPSLDGGPWKGGFLGQGRPPRLQRPSRGRCRCLPTVLCRCPWRDAPRHRLRTALWVKAGLRWASVPGPRADPPPGEPASRGHRSTSHPASGQPAGPPRAWGAAAAREVLTPVPRPLRLRFRRRLGASCCVASRWRVLPLPTSRRGLWSSSQVVARQGQVRGSPASLPPPPLLVTWGDPDALGGRSRVQPGGGSSRVSVSPLALKGGLTGRQVLPLGP